VLGILLIAIVCWGQSLPQGEVTALFQKLEQHQSTPAELLDPMLPVDKRQQDIEKLGNPNYRMKLEQTGPAKVSGNRAEVPVRVHLEDGNSVFDAETSLELVNRNGSWYFSSYDFLSFGVFFTIMVVVGCLVGVTYAAVVLTLRKKLKDKGKLSASSTLKLFIPVFWLALLRQVRAETVDAR
jgi:hypothetical protein